MTEALGGQESAVFLGVRELRIVWEHHHGDLDESQRGVFESRPEIAWLVCIPAVHVKPAVAKANELQRILFLANKSYKAELKEKAVETQRDLDTLRSDAEVFQVKKPKNPSRMTLG